MITPLWSKPLKLSTMWLVFAMLLFSNFEYQIKAGTVNADSLADGFIDCAAWQVSGESCGEVWSWQQGQGERTHYSFLRTGTIRIENWTRIRMEEYHVKIGMQYSTKSGLLHSSDLSVLWNGNYVRWRLISGTWILIPLRNPHDVLLRDYLKSEVVKWSLGYRAHQVCIC